MNKNQKIWESFLTSSSSDRKSVQSMPSAEDEIRFRELIKTPIRLFGWTFLYYFILILLLGIYFAHHLITISFNEQNVGIIDSTVVKKEIVEKKGGVISPVNFNLIKNPTQEFIAKGKELYDANCKSCHGDSGMGDGLAGTALNPKPRNFHQINGWTNGRTIDAMYKTLQEGIIKNGMPSYSYLSPTDRFSIILYIRTFSNFPAVSEEQISKLNENYNLSAETFIPNQIPVYKAENIIINENQFLFNEIVKAKEKYNTNKNVMGARLLELNSDDIDKVIKSFLSISNKSLERYIAAVSSSPLSHGYKTNILRLSSNKWKILYEYLLQITS